MEKKTKRIRPCYSTSDNLERHSSGFYECCFNKIKENEEEFFKYTRMTLPVYNILLTLIKDNISRRNTCYTISAECRLALTLSYLSQGVSHQFLGSSFKLGRSTAREIILQTCANIWNVLSPLYIPKPKQEDYLILSKEFENIWDLPNCVGAIDGKHISIRNPAKGESERQNSTNCVALVLLATCDARYKFTMVDVVAHKSQCDGAILANIPFGKELCSGKLPLPPPKHLPKTTTAFPYYFIGNATFPLRKNLMRPYPGKGLSLENKIYNYRITRARIVIDNAFGILVARWRILLTTINCLPENAEKVVLACVALHNFVNQLACDKYCPPSFADHEDNTGNIVPGEWRKEIETTKKKKKPVLKFGSNNFSKDVSELRNILNSWFFDEGAIDSQKEIE